MYRMTHKSRSRIAWRKEQEGQTRQDVWRPPALRRRITIEDFDGCEVKTHVIELRRSDRVDCYHAVIDGKDWKARIGWSRILIDIRKALPRLCSPRHFDGMGTDIDRAEH